MSRVRFWADVHILFPAGVVLDELAQFFVRSFGEDELRLDQHRRVLGSLRELLGFVDGRCRLASRHHRPKAVSAWRGASARRPTAPAQPLPTLSWPAPHRRIPRLPTTAARRRWPRVRRATWAPRQRDPIASKAGRLARDPRRSPGPATRRAPGSAQTRCATRPRGACSPSPSPQLRGRSRS